MVVKGQAFLFVAQENSPPLGWKIVPCGKHMSIRLTRISSSVTHQRRCRKDQKRIKPLQKWASVVSPTAATFYIYISFWSVLRIQALETPQRAPKLWGLLRNLLRSLLRNLLRNLFRNLLLNPVEPNLALHQSLPHFLRNLLWNPVEPDLALHQSLPDPPGNLLNLTWLCTKASLLQTLLRNLLRNPLNLTWLCTKASWNLLRNLLQNPVEPDLALHQASQTFSGTFSRTVLNLTWLATKPPRPSPQPSPEPSPEPCWTWPCSAPKPPRPSPEPSELSPEPRWTWPGACTSAHRSYSGLTTPLAYAVGGKKCWTCLYTHILGSWDPKHAVTTHWPQHT